MHLQAKSLLQVWAAPFQLGNGLEVTSGHSQHKECGLRKGTLRPCSHRSQSPPGCWWQRKEGKGRDRPRYLLVLCQAAQQPPPLPAGSQNNLFLDTPEATTPL